MQPQSIGHVAYLNAKRDAGLARVRCPRARARILGVPYALPPAKEHRITVNCRTGERTVETVEAPTPQKPNPFNGPKPAPAMLNEAPRNPHLAPAQAMPPTPRDIIRSFVAELAATGFQAEGQPLTVDTLLNPRRTRALVVPRHVVMWLTYKLCPHFSLPQLGRVFNRDHTTIMHAVRRAPTWLIAHPDMREMVDIIQSRFAPKAST